MSQLAPQLPQDMAVGQSRPTFRDLFWLVLRGAARRGRAVRN